MNEITILEAADIEIKRLIYERNRLESTINNLKEQLSQKTEESLNLDNILAKEVENREKQNLDYIEELEKKKLYIQELEDLYAKKSDQNESMQLQVKCMIEQIDSLKQSEKDFRKNEILLKENIDFERMRNEKLEERMGRLLADNVIERARNEKLEERVAKLLNERGILKNKLNEKESINAKALEKEEKRIEILARTIEKISLENIRFSDILNKK